MKLSVTYNNRVSMEKDNTKERTNNSFQNKIALLIIIGILLLVSYFQWKHR